MSLLELRRRPENSSDIFLVFSPSELSEVNANGLAVRAGPVLLYCSLSLRWQSALTHHYFAWMSKESDVLSLKLFCISPTPLHSTH